MSSNNEASVEKNCSRGLHRASILSHANGEVDKHDSKVFLLAAHFGAVDAGLSTVAEIAFRMAAAALTEQRNYTVNHKPTK